MPIPFNVWVKDPAKDWFVDEAQDLVARTAKKLGEKGTKAALSTALRPSPTPAPEPRTGSGRLVDEVPVEQLILLYFAIVNMNQGIGHGW